MKDAERQSARQSSGNKSKQLKKRLDDADKNARTIMFPNNQNIEDDNDESEDSDMSMVDQEEADAISRDVLDQSLQQQMSAGDLAARTMPVGRGKKKTNMPTLIRSSALFLGSENNEDQSVDLEPSQKRMKHKGESQTESEGDDDNEDSRSQSILTKTKFTTYGKNCIIRLKWNWSAYYLICLMLC